MPPFWTFFSASFCRPRTCTHYIYKRYRDFCEKSLHFSLRFARLEGYFLTSWITRSYNIASKVYIIFARMSIRHQPRCLLYVRPKVNYIFALGSIRHAPCFKKNLDKRLLQRAPPRSGAFWQKWPISSKKMAFHRISLFVHLGRCGRHVVRIKFGELNFFL